MIISLMAGAFSIAMLISMIVAVGLASYYFGSLQRKEKARVAEPSLALVAAARAEVPAQLDQALSQFAELQQLRKENQKLATTIAAFEKSGTALPAADSPLTVVPTHPETSRPEPTV